MVIGSRAQARIPNNSGGWEIIPRGCPQFGGVVPKSTPVHHGAQNDTAICSVVHQVGHEGKVVNRSNPGSPPSWRCWSIIRRNINQSNVKVGN